MGVDPRYPCRHRTGSALAPLSWSLTPRRARRRATSLPRPRGDAPRAGPSATSSSSSTARARAACGRARARDRRPDARARALAARARRLGRRAGREVELPDGRDRAVTFLGDQLAAIVHDPVLPRPAGAARGGRLGRAVRARERAASGRAARPAGRAARVARADRPRRRRGAPAARARPPRRRAAAAARGRDGAPAAPGAQGRRRRRAALLDETEAEVQAALAGAARARARHPPGRAHRPGARRAVRTLAERSPVPVDVRRRTSGFRRDVETAVYFVVAEALANVAKYAHATKASVTVERRDGEVVVEVRDDGVGGATPAAPAGPARPRRPRRRARRPPRRRQPARRAARACVAEIPCAS